MEMHMVVLTSDNLPKEYYGVDETYEVVGLWDSLDAAERCKEEAQKKLDAEKAEAEKHGYNTSSGYLKIISIETNKHYSENMPYIGGAFYIE